MNKFVAAIDIGTVTSRVLVAAVSTNDYIYVEELYKKSRITNIGIGVDASGLLQPDAIERTLSCVSEYKQVIDELSAIHGEIEIHAFATSATRDAKNSDEFVQGVRDIGIELAVATGDDEARLSFLGTSFSFLDEDILIADIGGGSTELVLGKTHMHKGALDARILKAHSFNIGGRRMNERFLKSNPPTAEELDAAYAWVHNEISEFLADIPHAVTFVPIAGTPTSVIAVRDKLEPYDPQQVHRAHASRAEVEDIYNKMCTYSLAERENVVGLEPKRAAVFPAGLVILRAVMDAVGFESFVACETDLLYGIVLDAALR